MHEITSEGTFPLDITPEKFKADFMEHGPVASLARYYGVTTTHIFALAIEYNLSIRKLNSERVRYKAKKAYEALVAKLRHHPTNREILEDKDSRKLRYAIHRFFGTLTKFQEAYGYPVPKKPEVVTLSAGRKAIALYRDYLRFGIVSHAALKRNISPSRAAQILRWGNAKGLFKYPLEKPKPLQHVTPKRLKEDYMAYGTVKNIAARYGVPPQTVANMVSKYKLPIREWAIEQSRKKLLDDYAKITDKLGHHPATTELERVSKSLYSRILHHYKSIDNFRKTYGYPPHKKGNPKWGDHNKQLSETNRNTILKYLKIKPGITSSEIAKASGVTYLTVWHHLTKLINEDIVYKVKKGLFPHYFLKNPGKITMGEKD